MGGVPLKWAVMFRMVSSLLNDCLTYTHPGNFHHPPHLSCRWQTGFGELGGELLISSKAAFVERKMVNTWIFGQSSDADAGFVFTFIYCRCWKSEI